MTMHDSEVSCSPALEEQNWRNRKEDNQLGGGEGEGERV